MSIRRTLLLASLAVTMIAAAPSFASAADVQMGGQPDPNAVITATGTIGYNMLGSWIQCTNHIEVRGNGSATTATVATWQITANTCEGEGLFEGCTLAEYDLTKEDGSTTEAPNKDKPDWTAHVVAGPPHYLKLTGVKIHEFLTNCEIEHLYFDFSETGLNLTPSTQTNFTAVTLHGEGFAELETNESTLPTEFYTGNETTGRGTVPLTGASSGTYSLG